MVGASRGRINTPVSQDEMVSCRSGGKSVPASMIQPTDLDSGGGEKRRAPMAEKVPAPPIMSFWGIWLGAEGGG